MGKSLFELENEMNAGAGYGAPGNRKTSSRTQRGTTASKLPSTVRQNQNTASVGTLFQLIWIRLRPTWSSLHYRAKVIFQKKNIVKFAVLATAGYFVVFHDKGGVSQSIPGVEAFEGESIMTTGATGKPKAKKTAYKSKNEAAPVKASELFAQEAESYIHQYSEIARKEQAEFGVPASISLAQGLVESRAGTSKLAVNNNNHFGMKCFSRHCKKGHCSNFTDDTHKDFFRKYPNPWESWREHSRMLSKGRYAKLKKHGTDYRKWAYGLKSIGYATDRTYAEKLIGVIERYNLHRFD